MRLTSVFSLLFGCVACVSAAPAETTKKVLYFTKSSGFEHSVIKRHAGKPSWSEQILADLGPKHGIEFTFSKDGSLFTPEYLAQFDAIMFFIFFEFVLVPMYFLIAGWGHENRRYAAIKFFLFTMSGSAFLFVGIVTVAFLHSHATDVLTFDIPTLTEYASTNITGAASVALFFALAIGFALMLFKVGPALLTSWLPIDSTGLFVVVEGVIRVAVFIGYILVISLLPDLRRVFQYHGAEHKTINALEAGVELTPTNVQKFSLIHPRCGTAFLLWVMVIAIFVFAFVGRPEWYWLITSRIVLLPVIAGLAYEVIRYAGMHQSNRILMTLLAPGLWLQRLTTREPSDDQVEVSILALRRVVEREEAETAEQHRLESRVEVMA